eukprot:6014390-Pyramimonas_sp.AAC.2
MPPNIHWLPFVGALNAQVLKARLWNFLFCLPFIWNWERAGLSPKSARRRLAPRSSPLSTRAARRHQRRRISPPWRMRRGCQLTDPLLRLAPTMEDMQSAARVVGDMVARDAEERVTQMCVTRPNAQTPWCDTNATL